MSEMDQIVVDTANRIFAGAANSREVFDAAIWSKIEEAGLDRLLLGEAAGGAGDAFESAAALVRCLGAHAAAIPLVETLVANWCLGKAGLKVPHSCKALALASGATPHEPLALHWPLPSGQCVVVKPGADTWTSVALIDAPSSGRREANVAGEPVQSVNAEDLGKAVTSGEFPQPFDGALALLATLKAAAIVGALESALNLTIEYANMRQQFGRRIGAFQAVQHMIARMAEEVAAASAATEKAARALAGPGGLTAAAIAKTRASDAAAPVVAMAHQCHGAIKNASA